MNTNWSQDFPFLSPKLTYSCISGYMCWHIVHCSYTVQFLNGKTDWCKCQHLCPSAVYMEVLLMFTRQMLRACGTSLSELSGQAQKLAVYEHCCALNRNLNCKCDMEQGTVYGPHLVQYTHTVVQDKNCVRHTHGEYTVHTFCSLVPGPPPSFLLLAIWKSGRGPGIFPHVSMMYQE